jgi:drug/metabolite transporter (DMT)-like permease
MAFRADERLTRDSALPVLQGIASGGFYAMAAVGFRGGILSRDPETAFYVRASETLVCSLLIQSVLLGLWMLAFQKPQLVRSFQMWRQSSFAGSMGALASQFWFLGFSLTSAANVRTLGLLEVIFAQVVSQRIFSQSLSRRELLGMILVVAGVGLLLATQV